MTEELKPEEKAQEDWITKKWRPMMAIMYMCVCACDFILFPILWTIVQFWEMEAANDAFRQWSPLTLQGGGLFHMAMGAVLGITAWSRGQEKMAGVASQSQPVAATMTTTTQTQQVSYGTARTEPGFNQGYNNSGVTMGYGGKHAPQQHFPEI